MERITKELYELQDAGYRDFIAKLVPSVAKENIIGIRTPALRGYAKKLSKDAARLEFVKELPHRYYEENALHGALLPSLTKDADEMLGYIEDFLPYVDNWGVCDTMAPKMLKKYPEKVYAKIKEWIKSDKTYTVRFAVVTLLDNFLDDEFRPEMLELVAAVKSEEYYVNMAVAWYFSFALIKQYDSTIGLIESKTLSPWVQNKSIQKAVESYRISDERKDYLRTLKIK